MQEVSRHLWWCHWCKWWLYWWLLFLWWSPLLTKFEVGPKFDNW